MVIAAIWLMTAGVTACSPKPADPETAKVAKLATADKPPQVQSVAAAPDESTLQAAIERTVPHGTPPESIHRLKSDWNGQAVVFVDYPVMVKYDGDDKADIHLTAFVPAVKEYRAVNIDTLEHEGGDAEISAIAFANADKDAAKELIVLVTWPVRHATVSGTLYEVRIFDDLGADARPLIALNQHFGSGCDCSGEDADPKRYAFRTITEIRKELTRMGY